MTKYHLQPKQNILTAIPMSRMTVKRRIEAVENDLEEQMMKDLKESQIWHAFQSDGSIDVDHKEQLVAFVRCEMFFSTIFSHFNFNPTFNDKGV